MGRKLCICFRRRVLHIRFIYYLILALIVILLVRLIKSHIRSRSQTKSVVGLKGVDLVVESPSQSLSELLKVDSTSKLCKKSKQIDVYEVCYETNVGKIPTSNVILASVEFIHLKFEEEIPYELEDVKVVQLVGNSQSYWEKLLKILFDLPLIGEAVFEHAIRRKINEIVDNKVQGPAGYALLKIGSLQLNQEQFKPAFIKGLVNDGTLLEFNQLFIVVNNDADAEGRKDWIETISLLKASSFQLFSVHRTDDCSDSGGTCWFGTSWLKIDAAMRTLDEEINPLDPNFDFGGKLHSLLRITTFNCRRKVIVPSSVGQTAVVDAPVVSRWPVCLDNISPPCLVYSAKIGGSELFESIMARLGCEVYVFDPTLNETATSKVSPLQHNIKKYNWTLGAANSEVVSGFENPDKIVFVKASEVLKKLGHENQVVDILRLDLHGGEWAVLDAIIAAKQYTNYQQLVLTVHVWHGEDKLNLMDRLVRLKKIFAASFRIFHSEPIGGMTKTEDNNGRSHDCCYVIGLLNSNLVT